MNLVASLIIHNELGRYLKPCVRHLQSYCDEIRVWDDGSSDGSQEWLIHQDGVSVARNGSSEFFQHEGRARQQALDWTLQAQPTHILAIDADEFIADPQALRATIEETPHVCAYGLCMKEVWATSSSGLQIRMDGGWVPHEVIALWGVPDQFVGPHWNIRDEALACGRVPAAVEHAAARRHGIGVDTEILHFGWARPTERQARYDRYVRHDGGRFHNSRHLDSIMWPDELVVLCQDDWPDSLLGMRMEIEGTVA